MKSDGSGQFRFPRSWRPADRFDSGARLVARKGDASLGWFDLKALVRKESPSHEPIQIVLLPRTQEFQGTLVGPDAEPLSNVRIAVDQLNHPANQGIDRYAMADRDLGNATTDRQGTFVVRLPVATSARLVPDDPNWQRRPISTTPDAKDLGRITLVRAGQIHGTVVDALTSQPLAGQRVFAQSQGTREGSQAVVMYGDAVTGQEGRYVIGGLSPGRFNVLFGGAPAEDGGPPALTA